MSEVPLSSSFEVSDIWNTCACCTRPVQSATFFAKTARRYAHACHERQSRHAVSRGATCHADHKKTSGLRRGSGATFLGPTLISGSVAVKSYNGFPTEVTRCKHRFKDQVPSIVRVGAQLLVQCPSSLTTGVSLTLQNVYTEVKDTSWPVLVQCGPGPLRFFEVINTTAPS